jgi:hypothetical protein
MLDGGGSSDPDGSIASYAWSFGDGSSGTGRTIVHTYASATSYTVTLTVTDNDGETATQSKAVTPIGLTARGYRLKNAAKVDLAWNGPSGAIFTVRRNGTVIATVSSFAYTDTPRTGSKASTYTYRVCAAAFATCSNDVPVVV